MSGAFVFVVAPQGMPLDCLVLMASRACFPEFHGMVINREMVLGKLPLPRHCADSRLKHIPSLYVIEVYLLLLALQPGEQASTLSHI